jgi:HPt (histidine-containing phosphotransfer) domain-containing protein
MSERFTVAVDPDVLDLAESFVAHRRGGIPRARAAVAEADWDLLHRLGHELKGTGGSFGFAELSAIGLALEQAAAERDSGRSAEAVERMASYLEHVAVAPHTAQERA